MGRGLEKRLQREAEVRALAEVRAAARAERAHARAVRKREGRLRRARERLPVHSGIAVAAGLLAGFVVEADAPDLVLWAGTALSGLVAARSARLLRRPPPVPVPPQSRPALPAPPPRGSAAWPYLLRLERVRAELQAVLPLVDPAGRDAAAEAWEAAGEADAGLRWQAARFAAVEPHRGPDPVLQRLLEDGVGAQERLLTAVLDLVEASAPGPGQSGARLQEAADRLHGLAHGLRTVRGDTPAKRT